MPEEDWKQGPKYINPLIVKIMGEGSPALTVDEALSINPLRAALADFEYDRLAKLMRMVPFPEEVRDATDPQRNRDRREKLNELAEGFDDIAADIVGDQKQVRQSDLNEINRYVCEARRELKDLRPRVLWRLGTSIFRFSQDEETEHALGERLTARLRDLAELHLDLMRDFFAESLARMRDIDSFELSEEATPDVAIDRLEAALKGIENSDGEHFPKLAEDDLAILFDQFDELKERKLAIDILQDPAQKQARLASFWRSTKLLALTSIRFSLRAAQLSERVINDVSGPVSVLAAVYPDQTRAVFDALIALFMHWPW